jgi:uncharacterized protein YndB with AHSA1/START domain
MISFTVVLGAPQAAAFILFTERISEWWPSTHRLTKDPASRITLAADGTFEERATDGRELPLGRVRRWEPPHLLEFDFYLGTSPEEPTHVTVRFTPERSGTRVTVEHRPTPGSAHLWDSRVARYQASWPTVLDALARFMVI